MVTISTARLEEALSELSRELTIVLVTHNLQQTMRLLRYTEFMYLGRLFEFGPPCELLTNPRSSAPTATSQDGLGDPLSGCVRMAVLRSSSLGKG